LPLFKKKEKVEKKEEKQDEKPKELKKPSEEKKEKKKGFKLGFSRSKGEKKKKEEKKVEEKPREEADKKKEEKPKKKGFSLGLRRKKEEKKLEEKPVEVKPAPPAAPVATTPSVEAGEEVAEKKEEKKEESREKKRVFGLRIGKKKEKPTPPPTEPAPPAAPVLKIVRKREKKKPRMRERGILTREVYKSLIVLVIEGFVFGSLTAILLYVALTGLMDSPVITFIANYLLLDTYTAFMLFVIPIGLAIGIMASDLIIKSQRGLGLMAILSRRGRRAPTAERRAPVTGRTLPLHPGRLSLAGVSLVIPATGLLLIYMFPSAQITMLTGAILLGVGVVVSLYLFITALRPPPPLPWYAALATEIRPIKPEESQKLAQLVKTAGVAVSPSIIMSKYIAIAILLSFLLIPAGVLIGFSIYFGVLSLDIAIMLIGLIVIGIVSAIYYPYIKLSQLKGERKRLVEKDLPFFAIYASIIQSAGLFLDHAFRRLIGNPLFPGIEREARLLERDIKLGKDPLEALTALALGHPSKRFKDFIFGYTSVVKSGWDTLSYLTMRIREYIQEIKFNWRVYSERAGGIGELLITLFLMSTTLFILIAVVLPYDVGMLMMVFNFVVLPLVTVVMIQTIDTLIPQPRIKDYYSVNILLVGATPFVVMIVLSMLNFDPIIMLEATFISALLAFGIDYQVQHAEIKGIESALPEFLRDITEYRKIGFPLLRAFFMIKETGRKYNKHFDKLLDVIIAQLRAGVRLNRVRVPTRSWLGKFVFWLLGEIEDTGGGTPAVLEEFTSLITDLLDAREVARKQLRIYNILAYITPFFLIVFVAIGIMINNMIKEVALSEKEAIKELQGTGLNMPFMLRPADEAIFHAKLSVFISSFLLAIAMTKAVDLTPRNTIRPTIISAMALILIHSVDLLANVFAQAFLSTEQQY